MVEPFEKKIQVPLVQLYKLSFALYSEGTGDSSSSSNRFDIQSSGSGKVSEAERRRLRMGCQLDPRKEQDAIKKGLILGNVLSSRAGSEPKGDVDPLRSSSSSLPSYPLGHQLHLMPFMLFISFSSSIASTSSLTAKRAVTFSQHTSMYSRRNDEFKRRKNRCTKGGELYTKAKNHSREN